MDIYFVFQIVNTILIGVFGIVIGSFLNVCIYRIPEGRTIVRGHSMCMTCGHVLGPPDLVPLFSWLLLQGKCRYCGAPIASRYAKIEGLTGAVFALLAWQRRSVYPLPGMPGADLPAFAALIFLLAASALIITAMMIQKDTGKGMYRFGIGVSVLLLVRFAIAFLKPETVSPLFAASAKALLAAAVLTGALVIFSSHASRYRLPGFSDIIAGKTVRIYFSAENHSVRTMDLLFLAVSASLGFPAAIPCLFVYTIVRAGGNRKDLLPYLGIILALSAFAGAVIFPGVVL